MKKTSVRPLEWVNKLLNRHGLTKPDGRPLYQYRVTDEEYLELQELLKLSVQMGFSNVSRMLSWDIAIVIYSAEWWRRYYAGQWSWEGIFGSIGLPLDEITIGRRNQFVELGLQRWNRDVRRLQGRRQFLGTIATEGGLPLNQLAEGGGWLKAILKPVIKKHLSRNLEIDLLIENYQDVIPSSYRSAEVKQILEDMVGAIVDLRKSHQLEEKSEPISWLDANVKQWRGHFPLPIGDETANALLIELVNVAARSKTEKGDDGLLFQVERFFTSVDHESEMQARLDAPAFVPIKRLNVDSGDQVPGRVEFELESDDGISRFWCRGIKTTYRHEETIKISTRSIQLKGQDALKGYKVVVKSFGEKITQLPITDGERLDIDIPWLFKESDGRFNLHGIASQSIKADKTVVYIPDRFDQDRVAESTEITKIIPIYEGALYKLAGQIICSDQLEKYKLKTNDEESAINYQIKGMLLLRDSIPAQIYIGAPSVDKLNTITGHVSRIPSDKLLGKPIGVDSPWRAMRPNDVGVFELRVIDADGSIAYRRKVGILPEDFCYTLQPDKTIKNKGSISIGISEENAISVDGENCVSNVKQGAGVLVELSTAEIPPQSIKVYILPRGHKNELVLSLPYPAKGALLFNPSNKLVNNKLPLYLNNLYGYRVDYFTDKYGPHIKGKLRFKLSDSSLSSSQAQDVYVEKPFTIREQVTEFAVIDWYQIIQNMLGVSKSLDSSVEISLLIGGSEEFRLSVGRYQHKLSLDWEGGSLALDSDVFSEIDVEEIEKTEVHTAHTKISIRGYKGKFNSICFIKEEN